VVDEEHEWTYKQDRTPRYHAREVAVKLGELSQALVILGSATPDVVTYYRSQNDGYRLLQLPERVRGGSLPPVHIVDMRRELAAGNRSIFSRALANAMAETLAAGEQVILFLNRRGTSTFIMCRDCGQVLRCRRCEVSLVYHAVEDELAATLCPAPAPPVAAPASNSSAWAPRR